MTEHAVPLSAEETDYLRTIRVCGCDGGCVSSNRCPSPVLDSIGADWIADHFDQLIATIAAKDAEIAELEGLLDKSEPTLAELEARLEHAQRCRETEVADLMRQRAALEAKLREVAYERLDADYRAMHDSLTGEISRQSAIIRSVSTIVRHIGGSATLWQTVAALEAKLREAEQLAELIVAHKKALSVVGGSYRSLDCPIYGGRPKDWTCIDEQQAAADPDNRYGDELRAALIAGEGLCLRCKARQLLSALQSAQEEKK